MCGKSGFSFLKKGTKGFSMRNTLHLKQALMTVMSCCLLQIRTQGTAWKLIHLDYDLRVIYIQAPYRVLVKNQSTWPFHLSRILQSNKLHTSKKLKCSKNVGYQILLVSGPGKVVHEKDSFKWSSCSSVVQNRIHRNVR